jgi:hypothetical protein
MAIEIEEKVKLRVQAQFPNLHEGTTFEYMSPVDFNYNCLSWAMSRSDVLFEKEKWGHWPWDSIADDTADGWSQMFQLHGFVITSSSAFVPGVERVAIYENEDGELHACRQDATGVWKSKLGDMGPDIDHIDLECLIEGYGPVAYILERPFSGQREN